MTASAPESSADPRTLLVVDDDEAFRVRVVRALNARGLAATGACDYEAALALARVETPEWALIDLKLPGRSGLEVVRDLKALDQSTLLVVLTGYGSIATAVQSVKLGAQDYLTKPVDADQILAAFRALAGVDEPPSPAAQPLARVEWEHIQRVLVDCDGNVSQAARLLGIHRRSLQRKLSKYPVPENR
ncbi:MAG: response regulator transcription factor [Vicinamibacterales bacterium]